MSFIDICVVVLLGGFVCISFSVFGLVRRIKTHAYALNNILHILDIIAKDTYKEEVKNEETDTPQK